MKKLVFVLIFTIAVLSMFVSCNDNPQAVYYHVKVMNGEEVYKEKDVVDGGIYVLPSVPKDKNKKAFSGWKIEGGVSGFCSLERT